MIIANIVSVYIWIQRSVYFRQLGNASIPHISHWRFIYWGNPDNINSQSNKVVEPFDYTKDIALTVAVGVLETLDQHLIYACFLPPLQLIQAVDLPTIFRGIELTFIAAIHWPDCYLAIRTERCRVVQVVVSCKMPAEQWPPYG